MHTQAPAAPFLRTSLVEMCALGSACQVWVVNGPDPSLPLPLSLYQILQAVS